MNINPKFLISYSSIIFFCKSIYVQLRGNKSVIFIKCNQFNKKKSNNKRNAKDYSIKKTIIYKIKEKYDTY